METYPQSMDYHQIRALLPYRSPWLLIDRLVSWERRRIVVQKVISGADPMVAAHFPEGPSVIPGVLYIELVSQSILFLGKLVDSLDDPTAKLFTKGKNTVLARCKADFLSPGFVGDALIADVTVSDVIAGTAVYDGLITCGERKICKVNGMASSVAGPLISSAY